MCPGAVPIQIRKETGVLTRYHEQGGAVRRIDPQSVLINYMARCFNTPPYYRTRRWGSGEGGESVPAGTPLFTPLGIHQNTSTSSSSSEGSTLTRWRSTSKRMVSCRAARRLDGLAQRSPALYNGATCRPPYEPACRQSPRLLPQTGIQ